MINIKTYTNTTNSLSDVNSINSILIIGRGRNERKWCLFIPLRVFIKVKTKISN